MIRVFFAAMLLNLSLLSLAQAQDNLPVSRYNEAREAEIAIKAKKRLYPGGRDEEDLRVQNQITNPPRKLAPQTEVREEPSEE